MVIIVFSKVILLICDRWAYFWIWNNFNKNVKSVVTFNFNLHNISFFNLQKKPFWGVLRERCSENMQQSYRRTAMPKCDFNKVAKQLCWNCTSAWVFSYKFAAYFQNTFSQEHLWLAASVICESKSTETFLLWKKFLETFCFTLLWNILSYTVDRYSWYSFLHHKTSGVY